MEAPDATTANADLWARYFQDQSRQWFNPFGTVSEVVEGTAASVAGLLTMVAAGPIAWLYNSNAPHVSEMARESRERALEEAVA